MYKVNPGEARTDLYGIGKGEAQVIDFSILRDIQKEQNARKAADEAAKHKAAEEEKAKTYDLLNKQIGQVHPADIEPLNKQMEQYRNDVRDAYLKGGGHLSIDDQTKLQQQYGLINQYALNSKSRLERDKAEIAKVEDIKTPFRPTEKQRVYSEFQKSSFSPEGQVDFAGVKAGVPMYDLDKQVEDAAKETRALAQANEQYGKTQWTPQQAGESAVNVIKNNPVGGRELSDRLREMNPDEFTSYVNNVYNSPKDAFGNSNPAYQGKVDISKITPENINLEDVAKYQYANRFMIQGQKFPPSAYAPGSQAEINKPAFYFDPNTNELSATAKTQPIKLTDNITENPALKGLTLTDVKPKFDDNGNVIGGIADVINPKQDLSKFREDMAKFNALNEQVYDKEGGKAGVMKTKEKKYAPVAQSVNDKGEYKVLVKDAINIDFPQGAPKHDDPKYSIKPEKVELTAGEAQRFFTELYKDKPQDVRFNKTAERTRLVELEKRNEQQKSITPSEFNAQWIKLKTGQKLVGPDGKTYIKK